MDEKLSAIERLEEILYYKDLEIRGLQDRIEQLELIDEYVTWGWARHIEIFDDELPVPRLQIEHRLLDEGNYNQEWIYSLVYKHLLDHSVVVPLGHTKVGGSFRPDHPVDTLLPFRDGAHFKHDMRELGLPGYIIFQGEATLYQPQSNDQP